MLWGCLPVRHKVLVTGGTTRLGLAIAAHLRECGWEVATSSHRPDSGADYIADFRGEWQLPEFDAIVNNAGLFTGPDADIMAVNYLSPKRIIAEKLAKNVVNILDSRILGASSEPVGAYCRSKWLLLHETLKFHDGVRVNAVAPGPVMAPTEVHEAAGPTPFGRPTPEAVAAAVRFLLEADYISGAVIPVDGGQHLL